MSQPPPSSLPEAQLTWRDGQPFSTHFDDPYFSVDNGLAESRYVFLQHNQLPQRWQHWPWQSVPCFNIIETGFGTGLNFLATWQAWRQHLASAPQPEQGWLHFSSIEKFPLNKEQLQHALALWPELRPLTELLLAHYPHLKEGTQHLVWPQERLSLTLWFADVESACQQLSAPVHAWYLDGFAPAKNPAMWSETLFYNMRRLSQSSLLQQPILYPTVATFSAAGLVRRGLQGAGFQLQKHPGFGRKREMLAGHYYASKGPEQPFYYWNKPWLERQPTAAQKVAIVGAGLAGCFTARALAERGVQVSVYDAQGIAQAASGNPQGGIYIKLNANDSALESQFQQQAYRYALRCFETYLGSGQADNPAWQQCGLLQLAYSDKEQQQQQRYQQRYGTEHTLFVPLNAEQASAVAGLPLNYGGFFFPQSGWVNPALLCQKLLHHPKIQFKHQAIKQLQTLIQHYDQVVLATAEQTATLLPKHYLPLRSVRGQLTYLSADQAPPLKTVISAAGYLPPADQNQLCLGASFKTAFSDLEINSAEHVSNLANLAHLGPDFAHFAQQGLSLVTGGRVAVRCSTPDYFPCVGQLTDDTQFVSLFQALAKDRKAIAKVAMPYQPSIWLNIAHGSKGLVSAPLCAEILACQMTGAALPVSQEVIEALWPGRFLLRDLARKKVASN